MKSNTLTFLQALAIDIPQGENARYFYGDNLEGYFEGCTGRIGGGNGYVKDNQAVVKDVLSFCGNRIAPRASFTQAEICPHTIRHHYGKTWQEELMLPRRQSGLIAAVNCTRAARVGLGPVIDAETLAVEELPEARAAVIRCHGRPHWVAVAADRKIALREILRRDEGLIPVFQTERPAKSLTLYIGLGKTAAQALRRAEALRDGNAVVAHAEDIAAFLKQSRLTTGQADYDKALAWAKLTSYFLVSDEFGKGIWAGLPWFKNNWGRDTFIALPGTLLVTGMFDEARKVITDFFRYQDTNPKSPTYGRVPNRVQSKTDIIYNTTDGTPWLIREVFEYLNYTGDRAFAKKIYPQVKLAINGAIKHYADPEGFLTHDDADTWMDARIEGNLPWSARGNRANDIQALWHNALLVGAELAAANGDTRSARTWSNLADALTDHFQKRFWNANQQVLADRITETNRRDEKVRPNQLMVLSIPQVEPLLAPEQEEAVVRNAVTELLFPYGIASLSKNDPYFHPFHHNDEWHHFDAAYHNGTVWGWNAGFTITALCKCRQTELAWKLARNLSDQILNLGCRGSMSELIEAIPRKPGQLNLSGTWAQAWSTAEFARNGYQDFGGFRPRLLEDAIELMPSVPKDWGNIEATYAFGENGNLHVRRKRQDKQTIWSITMTGYAMPLTLRLTLDDGRQRYSVEEPLLEGKPVTVTLGGGKATLNRTVELPGQSLPKVKPLTFAKPVLQKKPPSLRKKHFLQKRIEAGKYR
ncbi:MAG: glycogen debranching protein [Verrucomicrobia bacterium]|nr:glycogen debranching protein [Verrucomicrobiota bacterium]